MKVRYSQEFKNEVVEEFGRCRDVRQVVARYGVSRSTVYDWAKRLGVVSFSKQKSITNYAYMQLTLKL